MKKGKILISDFDGTFLRDDDTISSGNITAVKNFIKRGGIFVLSTGRMTAGVDHYLKNCGIKCLVSAFNGAEIVDLKDGKVLYKNAINNQTCVKVFELIESLKVDALGYFGDKIIVRKGTKYKDFYCKKSGVDAIEVESLSKYYKDNGLDSCKIHVLDDKEVIDNAFEPLKSTFKDLEVVRSEDIRIDITLKGVSKGEACKFISNYYGVDIGDIIAVGDARNDISMLKTVGFPIVVENAYEDVKGFGKIIAPSNNDDAIKYIIDNYCI